MNSKSKYSSSLFDEEKRLELQSLATRNIDNNVLNFISQKLECGKINILDVGCGYAKSVEDKFKKFENSTILGVDINQKIIEKNNKNNKNPNYKYQSFDVENPEFVEEFSHYLETEKLPKFDVIFIAYVLQHLKNPIETLKKLKLFLNDGGYIIIRGSDDGCKMSYNDQNLIDKIINLYNQTQGVSDRFNGRKIYSQLLEADFKEIKMFFDVKDTSCLSLQEKHEMFFQTFSYRINIYKLLAQENPDNQIYKDNLKLMQTYLNELEKQFENPLFWYAETQIIGIGKK